MIQLASDPANSTITKNTPPSWMKSSIGAPLTIQEKLLAAKLESDLIIKHTDCKELEKTIIQVLQIFKHFQSESKPEDKIKDICSFLLEEELISPFEAKLILVPAMSKLDKLAVSSSCFTDKNKKFNTSRLEHSLQVSNLIKYIFKYAKTDLPTLSEIEKSPNTFDIRTKELITLSTICALLHDAGHIAFSHQGEFIIKILSDPNYDHDDNLENVLLTQKDDNGTTIKDLLDNYFESIGVNARTSDIINIMSDNKESTYPEVEMLIKELADRSAYMFNDSFLTGNKKLLTKHLTNFLNIINKATISIGRFNFNNNNDEIKTYLNNRKDLFSKVAFCHQNQLANELLIRGIKAIFYPKNFLEKIKSKFQKKFKSLKVKELLMNSIDKEVHDLLSLRYKTFLESDPNKPKINNYFHSFLSYQLNQVKDVFIKGKQERHKILKKARKLIGEGQKLSILRKDKNSPFYRKDDMFFKSMFAAYKSSDAYKFTKSDKDKVSFTEFMFTPLPRELLFLTVTPSDKKTLRGITVQNSLNSRTIQMHISKEFGKTYQNFIEEILFDFTKQNILKND